MKYLDYSGLKIQLLGSVIAVSAIIILRMLVELNAGGPVKRDQFLWICAFHIIFLGSALVIAVVNKLKEPQEHAARNK